MKKNLSFGMCLLIAIGYVIGSGIFFKADDVLKAANGNTNIVLFAFICVGIIVTLTAYSIAQITKNTKIDGGIIAYMENSYGYKIGYLTGFFMINVFSPLLSGILSFAFVNYFFGSFLGLSLTPILSYLLAGVVISILFLINIFINAIARLLSTLATVIKIIPLILVALLGIFLGESDNLVNNYSMQNENLSSLSIFIAPFISIAFSFDGWISVGALSTDMKQPQKDIPRVFVLSLIIITILYTSYIFGITRLMDNDTIIISGDEHIVLILTNIFGDIISNILILVISISVLGTLNANIMAFIRYPYSIAKVDNYIFNDTFKKLNTKLNYPLNSAIYAYVLSIIAVVIYFGQYLINQYGFTKIFGVSLDNVTILISSITLLMLTFKVFRSFSSMKIKVISLIATVGQFLIVISFIITTPGIVVFIIMSIILIFLALYLYKEKGVKSEEKF